MATERKILGQLFPAADTIEDLYVVPASTEAASSTMTICNLGDVEDTVYVICAEAGASIAFKQAIYWGLTLSPKDTFAATIGMTLSSTDVIRVKSTLGTSSFNLFGMEIT